MTTSIGGTTGITFNDASVQNTASTGFGFKNRIINGAMVIDQRNAGASGTAVNVYTVDRWQYGASVSSKGTWQQNAGAVTPPAGFSNYLGFTSSSAYSVSATDFFTFSQVIEGFKKFIDNTEDQSWKLVIAATLKFDPPAVLAPRHPEHAMAQSHRRSERTREREGQFL